MIKYYCDVCNKKVNKPYKTKIVYINHEEVEVNACVKCEFELDKLIKKYNEECDKLYEEYKQNCEIIAKRYFKNYFVKENKE